MDPKERNNTISKEEAAELLYILKFFEESNLSSYNGLNKETFLSYIKHVTQEEDVNDIRQILQKIESGEITATTPEKMLSELKEEGASEEILKKAQSYTEARNRQAESVKNWIKAKTENNRQAQQYEVAKINKESENIKSFDTSETLSFTPVSRIGKIKSTSPNIYVTPVGEEERTLLTEEQVETVKLVRSDPKKFADELTKKIIETSPTEIEGENLALNAEIIAKDFTFEKPLSIDPSNPNVNIDGSAFEILSVFANPNSAELTKLIPNSSERILLAKTAQLIGFQIQRDSFIAAQVIENSIGSGWTGFYMPQRIRDVEIKSKESSDATLNIGFEAFKKQLQTYMQTQKRLDNKYKSENPDLFKNASKEDILKYETELKKASWKIVNMDKAFKSLVSRRGYFTSTETRTDVWATHLSSMGAPQYFEPSGFLSMSSLGGMSFGNNLSSPLVNFAFNKAVSKIPAVAKLNTVVAGIKTKVTTKIAAKLAASSLANIVPVVGQIVSVISLALTARDIYKELKRLINNNPEILVVPVVVTAIASGLPAVAFAGFAFGVGIRAYRAARFARFLKRLLMIILSPLILIGNMLLFYLIFTLTLAIVLYIITSGAYVVPPGTGLGSVGPGYIESPYIEVIKTPSPPGPFENSDLPLEIRYTVQIIAKKGTLTNIQIEYDCSVIKENSSISCPPTEPLIPDGIDIPDEISPSNPFDFSYTQEYTLIGGFEDTRVIDIISVTADSPEQAGSSGAGSANIVIGNPPDDCPSGWPVMPEGSETSIAITQGPDGGFSHRGIEAADFGTTSGHSVKATHSGIATVVYTNNAYKPIYVDISSTCNGVGFISRYAHLDSASISSGIGVVVGQEIGKSGTNGTGPHLHYEFRGLKMDVPNIPKHIPYGCSNNCGYIP